MEASAKMYREVFTKTLQAQRKRSVEVCPHAPASANASGFADFGRVTLAWQAMTSSVLSKVTEMERLMTEDHERIINERANEPELPLRCDTEGASSIAEAETLTGFTANVRDSLKRNGLAG